MSRTIAVILILTSLVACGGAPPQTGSNTGAASGDATALLKAVGERYASSHSYEDRGNGSVTKHSAGGTDGRGPSVEFKTAFDRVSGGYRFEFTRRYPDSTDAPDHGAIWRRAGGSAHTWSSLSGDGDNSVCDAMIGFSAASLGTSFHVPSMLFGLGSLGDDKSMLRGFAFRFDGEENVGGTSCTRVSAEASGTRVSLWIGKSDLLLRRVVQSTISEVAKDVGDAAPPPAAPGVEIRIEYEPKSDVKLDSTRFDFVPESPKQPPATRQ